MALYDVHIRQGFSAVVGNVEANSEDEAATKVWDSPNLPRNLCSHCGQNYYPDGEPEVVEVVLVE